MKRKAEENFLQQQNALDCADVCTTVLVHLDDRDFGSMALVSRAWHGFTARYDWSDRLAYVYCQFRWLTGDKPPETCCLARIVAKGEALLASIKEPGFRRHIAHLLYRRAWPGYYRSRFRGDCSETPLTCEYDELAAYVESIKDNPLAQRNYHYRDWAILFTEENHRYTLWRWNARKKRYERHSSTKTEESDEVIPPETGKKATPAKHTLDSVTTYKGLLFPKFDADKAIAGMKANEKKWASPTANPYFGQSDEQIKEGWELKRDTAAKAGTYTHRQIELKYLGLPYDGSTRSMAHFAAFERAEVEGKLRAYRAEWMMSDEELSLTGSADILYEYLPSPGQEVVVEPDDPLKPKHLVLMDWKCYEELVKFNSYESGHVFCTYNMGHCNYIDACIQLCSYKHILEKHYNVVIDAMFIILLHPSQRTYLKEEIHWNDQMMEGIFAHRRAQLWLRHYQTENGKL